MPKKSEHNLSGERLRKLIDEALLERQKEQKAATEALKFIPPPAWPVWPHLDGATILGSSVSKEIGSPERSKELIEWRLKRFAYPYPEGNKTGKTFYQHVQKLGLLDTLKEQPLLWDIRRVWWFQLYYEGEVTNKQAKKSEYGYPFEFHRKLMNECSSHLQRIEKLLKGSAVHESWTAKYRKAILKQLLNEAAIYYPRLLASKTPALRFSPSSHRVDMRLVLFDAITKAFSCKKIKNDKLAVQLTALLSSGQQAILEKKLDPSPNTVLASIKDRKRRRS